MNYRTKYPLGKLKAILAFLAFISFLTLTPTAWGQGFGYMDQIPEEEGFVNDFAGLLSPQERTQLNAYLTQNAQQTSNEIVVAIMDLPEGADIKQFTNDMARKWGIGGSDNNNGALLAIFPNQRKVRIEVGYGLEPVITDALSGRIIREVIRPAFQREDYYNGISRAAHIMADVAKGEYSEQNGERYYSQPGRSGRGSGGGNLLVLVIIIILVITLIRRGGGGGGGGYGGGGWSWFPLFWIFGSGWGGGGGHHGGGWGGGSGGGFGGGFGGGDFGGFGGGDFGGGGADGGW